MPSREDDEREEHEHGQPEHPRSGCGSSALTNCGKNARKKIESLGLRMLIKTASVITCAAVRDPLSLSTESAPRVAQRVTRHVEQIGHAQVLERLERERARVQRAASPMIVAAM